MSVLGDSASCAAGSNPLAQMNKYMSADRSLQREQQGQSHAGGSLRGGEMRQLSQGDRQLYQSLQQGNRPDSFHFGEMRNELPVDRSWGQEFAKHNSPGPLQSKVPPPPAVAQSNWLAEFNQHGANQPQQGAGPASQMQMAHMPMSSMGMPMSSFGFGGMHGGLSGASQLQPQQQPASAQQAAPSKVEEAKWEEEFSKVEREATPPEAAATATAESETAQAEAETFDLRNEEEVLSGLDHPELGSYFNENYPPNWDEMWDNITDGANATAHVRAENFRAASGTYEFAKENEFAAEDDPFAMGVYMMDHGAKLSCAALCFEEAVKRDPAHVEAWARLGDAQAQNEVEESAIIALERAVSLNPRHERALLNLAISYTNEGYDAAASQILEKWIVAKYPDIAELVPAESAPSRAALHKRVTDMFLTAAQRAPQQGLDPDVQVGLGVLCYRDDDYAKAIDCFRSALSVRPNDASLWNRLGATLANASRPEEAIDAYYKALSLRPSFVRARYNLAVSCINIGCYSEAAENILSAISLHDTDEGDVIDFNRSSNLIDTLRRVFFAMDRRDLIAKLAPGAKLSDFRSDFKF